MQPLGPTSHGGVGVVDDFAYFISVLPRFSKGQGAI